MRFSCYSKHCCFSGTNINSAILDAVSLLKKERKEKKVPERSMDMIFLLTDGMPNSGETILNILCVENCGGSTYGTAGRDRGPGCSGARAGSQGEGRQAQRPQSGDGGRWWGGACNQPGRCLLPHPSPLLRWERHVAGRCSPEEATKQLLGPPPAHPPAHPELRTREEPVSRSIFLLIYNSI